MMTTRTLLHLGLLAATMSVSTLTSVRAADEAKPAEAKTPKVKLETSMGDIVIELNPEKAPITVKNFLEYVEAKHYDGTVFHRVISNFMIQGGGFETKDGQLTEKKTKAPITNEGDNGLKNENGSIAMARTSNPNSATAQFFINVKDNDFLNGSAAKAGYAVFGKVTEGMDIVSKIKEVPTGKKPLTMDAGGQMITQPSGDVPQTDVVIKKASVVK
jgi:cyclophilin family peptidyl-prolyl cis-trans isomerase